MERIVHALGHVCANERERVNRTRYEVAALLDNDDPNRIRRFETGQNTPRDLDRMVSAYAEIVGMTEWALWTKAVNLLHAPDAPPERPARPKAVVVRIEVSEGIDVTEVSAASGANLSVLPVVRAES